jgi:integrase
MVGRTVARLTVLAVTRAKEKGMYADGGGLYLHVSASGAKSWIYRFMLAKRPREMGLGPTHTISLAEARDMAVECRKLRRDGIDPIEIRYARRQRVQLDAAKAMTFTECATRYIAAHKAGWRSPKSLAAWEGTLATFVDPVFGQLPVQAIDTGLVTKALAPIWTTKPETAGRVRGRIETILDYATVNGWREGVNPARWRGHLDKALPNKAKVRAVEHHPALPFAELPGFLEELRQENGVAARALEFAIVTSARTGEVIGARGGEIDPAGKLWTIPGARMKGGREHRVPLSDAALAIIEKLPQGTADEFLFPGGKAGRPLSNMAMLALLKRMKRSDLTVHGFRSTFRDWAAERTTFQNEVIEMALAHAVGDKVEAAYRRGDLFDKRRGLMEAWGAYGQNAPAAAAVVPIRSRA